MFQKNLKLKIKNLERSIDYLEESDHKLRKSCLDLQEKNSRLEQIDEKVIESIAKLVNDKWISFTSTIASSNALDNHVEKMEDITEALKKDLDDLKGQMKATDKVFFLADKVDKFLESLTNPNNTKIL